MSQCPQCGSPNLESLGIERGERLDPWHTCLISKFKCQKCECEFSEVIHCAWAYEVTKHGNMEHLVLAEWTQ